MQARRASARGRAARRPGSPSTDPMVVRRSEPVPHQLSFAVAVAAAAASVILIARCAPSSRSETAAARRAPTLAASEPVSGATAEFRVEPQRHTAASLAMALAGDEASSEDRDLLAWVEWKY